MKMARFGKLTAFLMVFVDMMLICSDVKGMGEGRLMDRSFILAASLEGPQKMGSVGPTRVDDRVLFENKDGEIIHLASLKGKVTFINFWATWCPPCIAEMPSIQKLYSNFKEHEGVVFMMLDVDNKRERSQKFMDRKKYDLPVYTPVSVLPASYMSGAIPTTLVLNKYGRIVFKHEGMGDFSTAEFKTFIEQLIAE